MAEPGSEEPREEADEPAGIDRWLRPYFEDSTLWPILLVAIAIFVSFGAALILLGVFERRLSALAALALLLVISGDLTLRELRGGRFGLVGGTVLGFWVLSVGAALLARHLALF